MGTKAGGLRRAPRLDDRWEAAIKRLVDEVGLRSAKQVQERLKREVKKEKSAVYGLTRVPDIRTVRDRVRRLVPDDGSGPWTMAEATASEAEAVMPVLAEIAQRAEGRVPVFSQNLARLISNVHAAAPSLGAWTVYQFALAYWRRGEEPTEDLDLALAFRPWLTAVDYVYFEMWVRKHRPQWLTDKTMRVDDQELPVPGAEGLLLAIQAIVERLLRLESMRRQKEGEEGTPDSRWAVERLQEAKRVFLSTARVADKAEGGSEEEPNGG